VLTKSYWCSHPSKTMEQSCTDCRVARRWCCWKV